MALYRDGSEEVWSDSINERIDWQIACSILASRNLTGSILDVGCYTGGFLRSLDNTWARYGVELNKKAAAIAGRHDIRIVGETIGSLEMPFDVVTAFDVMEHVPNPSNLLNQMGAAVKPGGVVLISTSDATSLTWRLLGSRHPYCVNPEHISFINPEWCKNVAAACGLRLIDTVPFSHGVHSFYRRIIDLLKAVGYVVSPRLFAWLRRHGFGTLTHAVELCHPPAWPSARDHMLVVFDKP